MAAIGALAPNLLHKDPVARIMTWGSASSLAGNSSEPLQMTFTFPAEFKTARFRRLTIMTIRANAIHVINAEGQTGHLQLIRDGKVIIRFLPSLPMKNCIEDGDDTDAIQSQCTWNMENTPIITRIQSRDILDIVVPPMDDGAAAVDVLFALEVDQYQP